MIIDKAWLCQNDQLVGIIHTSIYAHLTPNCLIIHKQRLNRTLFKLLMTDAVASRASTNVAPFTTSLTFKWNMTWWHQAMETPSLLLTLWNWKPLITSKLPALCEGNPPRYRWTLLTTGLQCRLPCFLCFHWANNKQQICCCQCCVKDHLCSLKTDNISDLITFDISSDKPC